VPRTAAAPFREARAPYSEAIHRVRRPARSYQDQTATSPELTITSWCHYAHACCRNGAVNTGKESGAGPLSLIASPAW
jgi:hypothetical protein